MAVEKMYMMDLVGDLQSMDSIVWEILNSNSLELVNVMNEVENNRFNFSLESSNLDKTLDLNYLSHFERDDYSQSRHKKIEEVKKFYNIDTVKSLAVEQLCEDEEFDNLYNGIKEEINQLSIIEQSLNKMVNLEKNFNLFKNIKVDIKDLEDLNYFEARFGLLTSEGRLRFKRNYGNILAVIFHTGTQDEEEVYLAIYPKEAKPEIDRILKSLNWKDIEILGNYSGTAGEILVNLFDQEKELSKKKEEIESSRDKYYRENRTEIERVLASEIIKDSIEDNKKYLARSNKFFYLSGWISHSDKVKMEAILKKYPNLLLSFKDVGEDKNLNTPPTKLKNLKFFKPFEILVKMYGIPSYHEFDPTVFVGITYMIFFGAMFGDVGQGAIFIAIGLLIAKYKDKMAGGLMVRVGLSSTLFGFLYGSVFGNEHLIDALWLRPFENINKILIISIGFGVFLLSLGYILSLVNAYKEKNFEEGIFGNEGAIAFLMFISIVTFAVEKILHKDIVPGALLVAIIIISMICLFFRAIIVAALKKEKPHYESGASSYYIENGFSLIETLIAMVSGVISFIRLGAFAINHVGLFLAFQTIGNMVGSGFGNIVVLIIGNIVIIGLEGLIVFIQGLRLEYYELFNKYYKGGGYEFKAAKVRN